MPAVELSSNFDSAPGFDTIASAQYAFTVVGGHSGDLVPLLVDTRLVSAAAGNSFAAAGIVVTIGSSFVQERVCTKSSDCPQTSFAGTLHIGIASGQSGT